MEIVVFNCLELIVFYLICNVFKVRNGISAKISFFAFWIDTTTMTMNDDDDDDDDVMMMTMTTTTTMTTTIECSGFVSFS